MTEKEYDIKHLENQIKLCTEGIEKGSWEGYAENLKNRKERLVRLKKELTELRK